MNMKVSPARLIEWSWIGVAFLGDGAEKFWEITCPCGITATYPVNGLPTVNTPHPCGKPNHWVVQYEAAAREG